MSIKIFLYANKEEVVLKYLFLETHYKFEVYATVVRITEIQPLNTTTNIELRNSKKPTFTERCFNST